MENGHIHIHPDKSLNEDGIDVKGFFIVNNCENRIKDLSDVLTVFKSTKGSAADVIGENGVGVKQGCATLSDRSFVLCRNKYEYSLGVVALELQKETGIYLPSFKFSWDPLIDGSLEVHIDYQLRTICRENNDVAAVIENYGDGNLSIGIMALLNHFLHISSGLWDIQSTDHVFNLIICELKHGNVLDYYESDDENSDDEFEVVKMTRKKLRTERRFKKGFLSQIHEGLPRHYLHVGHSFDVQVDGKVVSFSYWQRRLVEMSHFKLLISKKEIKDNEEVENYNGLDLYQQHQYMLDIYCGFDAIRCADPESKKRATLVYHSRRAGRLIKEHEDARGELSLSAGGTTYCQGLTIVVDDKHGHFPLNPTKTGKCVCRIQSSFLWEYAQTYIHNSISRIIHQILPLENSHTAQLTKRISKHGLVLQQNFTTITTLIDVEKVKQFLPNSLQVSSQKLNVYRRRRCSKPLMNVN
jgi:hypothetical protein